MPEGVFPQYHGLLFQHFKDGHGVNMVRFVVRIAKCTEFSEWVEYATGVPQF